MRFRYKVKSSNMKGNMSLLEKGRHGLVGTANLELHVVGLSVLAL
jgi:hypothetical protein